MKPILITTVSGITRRFNFIVVLIICMLLPVLLPAQADTTIAEQTDPPEEPSLISPSIELISVQKSDNTIELKASLKAKIKGTLTKLHHLKVRFYLLNDSAGQELGAINADRNGVAQLNIKGESINPDKDGNMHFKAVVAGNKSMEAAETELTIKKALLTITPVKEDSILTVQVKLADMSTGTATPVKEAALGIYVKRLFNPLKIGEGTTDENGEISVTIPDGLPGDAKGNITLMARLDENEVYGNLEAAAVQQWGTVVSDKPEEQPRALWSSHPPLWMLITFIVLMVAVWGHYIIIIFQLIRLRKEQPVSTIHTTNN